MHRYPLLLLLAAFVAANARAALTPNARAEIDQLMSALETSGCTFNRNGSWYPAVEAKTHLLRKLKYLDDRNMVNSVEQFIELAGSSSSSSRRPYLVKCGNGSPVESRTWLLSQLAIIRSGAQPTE